MCFDDDSRPPIPMSNNSSARGEDVHLRAADGTRVLAYRAQGGESARAQVVILPDVRGLHTFYKELALRFAGIGMRALVIDYFARTAENDDRTEAFEFMPHVQQMTPENFGQDLAAAIADVRTGEGAYLPTFTLGFCMGGSLSFWAGTRGHDLAGVIGFYAGLTRTRGAVTPAVDWASKIQSPVLGLFGGADEGIPQADIDRFEHGLEEAGTPHEIVVYPGAPHSFFDKKASDYADASADAWQRVQGFIADHEMVRV